MTTFVDPNGNYEVDGHYWTVYLAALLAGKSNAGELAYKYVYQYKDHLRKIRLSYDNGLLFRNSKTYKLINKCQCYEYWLFLYFSSV
ncbi:hypothetical protein [Flavobacterium sp. N502540]|uniref:hypothetical protein n=1 Tax=Flavobacterium sp. N502540 TaxID=2986838 RepID=UPI0022253A85|nr:hypothetical protein [Flavobacterium sp. N502540]